MRSLPLPTLVVLGDVGLEGEARLDRGEAKNVGDMMRVEVLPTDEGAHIDFGTEGHV